MALLTKVQNSSKYLFWCEGCECCHFVDGVKWRVSGGIDTPTVTPSIKVEYKDSNGKVTGICHLSIKGGVIKYHASDTTHDFSGKEVQMLEMDAMMTFKEMSVFVAQSTMKKEMTMRVRCVPEVQQMLKDQKIRINGVLYNVVASKADGDPKQIKTYVDVKLRRNG